MSIAPSWSQPASPSSSAPGLLAHTHGCLHQGLLVPGHRAVQPQISGAVPSLITQWQEAAFAHPQHQQGYMPTPRASTYRRSTRATCPGTRRPLSLSTPSDTKRLQQSRWQNAHMLDMTFNIPISIKTWNGKFSDTTAALCIYAFKAPWKSCSLIYKTLRL